MLLIVHKVIFDLANYNGTAVAVSLLVFLDWFSRNSNKLKVS